MNAAKNFVRLLLGLWLLSTQANAATFTNNASIQVATDSTSSLTSTSGVFTVSCWFRISIPSSLTLSDNMTILMDRADGNESSSFSYLIRFNATNGTVEFLTGGASSPLTLISQPYLDRWYHVAVSRNGSSVNAYVDGRSVATENATTGNTTGKGLSIGGINGSSKLFYGDIIEVAFYQSALQQNVIQDRMFKDQRTFANLKGYYKLAYSTNASDYYRNVAPSVAPDATKIPVSGSIDFPQIDQAGEQSLFDSRKNRGNDALTPLSGAFTWQQTALARPTPGIAFDFQFGYSSVVPTTKPSDLLSSSDPYDTRVLSPGWRNTFDTRIVLGLSGNEFQLVGWDGAIDLWDRTNNALIGTNFFFTFTPRHHEYRGELVQIQSGPQTGDAEWTTAERLVYHFHDPTDTINSVMAGRLLQIRDFNSNSVQLIWDENLGIVTNVLDTAGGTFQFSYSLGNLLTNVTFGQWQVNFGYDTNNRLASKSLTNISGQYTSVSTTWQFRYNTNGLLSQIIDPRTNTSITIQYDQYGRQTNQVDALGRTNRIEYNVPAIFQLRRTDASAFQWVESYDRKGHILTNQDPLANITAYAYDTNGNRIRATDANNNTTTFGYDSRANVIAKTNALGEVTTWSIHPFFNKAIQQVTPQPLDVNGSFTWTNYYLYDAAGNLLSHSDDLGTLVSYTYSSNGLVLTSTDANTNTTSFTYDTNGFLTSTTDASNNTTYIYPNEIGWKIREENALGDPTSYTYDLNGNAIRIQDVIGRVFNKTYDADGNLLTTTDGKGQITSYAYDAANQKTNMVDRTGTNKWSYFYTVRGKVDHVTDPLGYSTTNFFDAANRLIRISDAIGQSVTNQYDGVANIVTFTDKVGQRWTKIFDRLNRITAEVDPLNNTRSTAYDSAGRVKQITSANGYPSVHHYDGRGRLTRWTDPQGFDWKYSYDGVGNIVDIEDALHGHYVMSYGARNERLTEKNQDNKTWSYAYDELLRLEKQTDPNGIVRTPIYDAAGRVLAVDFSTLRRDSFNYDENDNPLSMSRRYSGVTTATQLTYDALDRVVQQTDAFGKSVLYGYDPLGRVTAISYPVGKLLVNSYDPLGRLVKQSDWGGRQTTYTYDAADRLTSRTYPNGIIQTNAFDNAGHITSLSYSPPNPQPSALNIALTYAYDRNGNKVGGGETGTLNWQQPSLTDESAAFTPAGRLINRSITQPSTNNTQNSSTINYQYDPSGNMTNASGNGQTWALTYDEDNRTTSIKWDCGFTARNVTNRYDALGRRVSKISGGDTNAFVLSLVGGMERILCDVDGYGNISAWYIHGTDLCYKVDATNGLTCYHADAMANIIALSTTAGTNAVLYAYTPYGRCLGSTNLTQFSTLNSQPFMFAGSQGVMNEFPDLAGTALEPNLYFMRARYYSSGLAVFLSTDPLKKMGADWHPTLYTYVGNHPLNAIDAEGTVEGAVISLAGDAYDVLNAGYILLRYRDIVGAVGVFGDNWVSKKLTAFVTGLDPTVGSAVSEGLTVGPILNDVSTGYNRGINQDANYFTTKSGHSIASDLGYREGDIDARRGPNGPNADSTPMYLYQKGAIPQANYSASLFQQNSSQQFNLQPQINSRTAVAGMYGSALNQTQQYSQPPPTKGSGTTTSGGSNKGNSGGGTAKGGASTTSNGGKPGAATSTTASNLTNNTGFWGGFGNLFSGIGNFFSNIFHW